MKKEIIFVHIPKTAGGSIREICNKKGITVIGHSLRNPDYISIEEYKKISPKNKFAFAFVRNPWDRVVSAFFYLNQGGINDADNRDRVKYLKKFNGNFDLFVRNSFQEGKILEQLHFRPQKEWISNENKEIIVDFVGKFENLQGDFNKVCEMFHIKKEVLPITKKTEHDFYKNYYNKETREMIAKTYREDIRLFGYDF
ncbi:MAG: sulfotransferase family 2 domain-containing protein [Candidatus Woesearchaeota archaeon]